MTENKSIEDKNSIDSGKKKGRSFALSAIIVGLGTFITKFSGLLRQIVVADRFSQGIYRDSFDIAFTLPDLVFNLLIGGAIYSTIAPFLSAQRALGKEKEAVKTVSIFISVASVVMITFSIIGTIFSGPFYSLYALGQTKEIKPEVLTMAAQASKFLFPQIFFMMLAAFCNGIYVAYRKFAVSSFGPFFYNVLSIIAIFVLGGNSPRNLVMTTGGILVITILYSVIQYFLGFKQMKHFRFIFKPGDSEFLKLFRRAIPILISASIVQINAVVLKRFALPFGDGNVYGYSNASTIWQIPYSVFVVAVTTVMTPELAGDYVSKRFSKASELVAHSLKSALFMTIPSAAFIAVMSLDVVKAVFQWNPAKYTDQDAATAATFLLGFCIAIIGATVVHVFNQAFYAIGMTKVPLLAGLVGLVINPLACQVMVTLGVGPLSLSLAYSFTTICQMVMLSMIYCRRKELAPRGIIVFLLKAALSVAVMSLIVFIFDKFIPAHGGKITQLTIIAGKGVAAVVIYFAMAVVLKMEEATEWIEKFKAKLLKKTAKKA